MRPLAGALLLLMLAVVGTSAWLRLGAARAACADWPGCRTAARAVAAPDATASAEAPAASAVRGMHRAAASAALAIIVVLLVRARRAGPWPGGARAMLVALLVLALALAVLGVVTPRSRSVGVLLGNLLGGFAMLALAWSLQRALAGARALPPRLRWLAAGGALLWLVQAATGALSGAGLPQGSAAPYVHLGLAMLAAGSAIGSVALLRDHPRRLEGRLLLGLVVLQVAFGGAAAYGGAAAGWVWLHNLVAAVTLALWTGLASARS